MCLYSKIVLLLFEATVMLSLNAEGEHLVNSPVMIVAFALWQQDDSAASTRTKSYVYISVYFWFCLFVSYVRSN